MRDRPAWRGSEAHGSRDGSQPDSATRQGVAKDATRRERNASDAEATTQRLGRLPPDHPSSPRYRPRVGRDSRGASQGREAGGDRGRDGGGGQGREGGGDQGRGARAAGDRTAGEADGAAAARRRGPSGVRKAAEGIRPATPGSARRDQGNRVDQHAAADQAASAPGSRRASYRPWFASGGEGRPWFAESTRADPPGPPGSGDAGRDSPGSG